jgi:hypothetical protein
MPSRMRRLVFEGFCFLDAFFSILVVIALIDNDGNLESCSSILSSNGLRGIVDFPLFAR